MTLVSTIIQDAYRESNLIAIAALPTSSETAEALRLLNRIFNSVFGDEMGEGLQPIAIGRNNISLPSGYPYYDGVPSADWFVPDNTRLAVNTTQSLDIYLSPRPRDGSRFAVLDSSDNLSTYPMTVHGNGRTIEAATTVTLNTDALIREWFYRADLGDWKRISNLVAGDTFPFPEKFDDLFITALAMRLNPRNAVQADPQSVESYRRGLRQFRAQYRQTREVGSEIGISLLTLTPNNWAWGNSENATDLFNSGRPNP